MGSWKKHLRAMRQSERCVGFTYEEAASVLRALDFEEAPNAGTSHRKWRRLLPSGRRVIIGLLKDGKGSLSAVYIKQMLSSLDEAGLLPPEDDL